MHKKENDMKRRDFIKLSANAALLLAYSGISSPLYADTNTSTPKTVINIMLSGGPDMRHLIVPKFTEEEGDDSYAAYFWKSRKSIWQVNKLNQLREKYSENYDTITINGKEYGILKNSAWLKEQILAGNVAIINNVVCSENRDHVHSRAMLESGSLDTNDYSLDVSGWAGRAAKELGANVVSVTPNVRLVCNGPSSTNTKSHDNSCVISNYNSRDMGLYNYDTQADLDSGKSSYKYSDQAMLSRSLSSYYAAKKDLIAKSSPFRKPIEHEIKLRKFGKLLKNRLDNKPIPESISNLYTKGKDDRLNSSRFAHQILALHDSFATQDILNMRLASMDYTGWDSHKHARTQIEPKFEDIFGTNKGLDALTTEIQNIKPDSYNNSVIAISGEFGRQHLSNGGNGSDHGRGNMMLVIGGSVNGGMYGEPFSEKKEDLLIKNKDIEGKTDMFKVYAQILDWQKSGTGAKVFKLDSLKVESGVDLSAMFA